MYYNVNEIFYSIQGEGHFTGYPAIFIRFAGCNLECPWCDTDKSHRRTLKDSEIYNKIEEILNNNDVLENQRNDVLFVLTGGEPTMQEMTYLIIQLKSFFPKNKITMETNGNNSHLSYIRELRKRGFLWTTVSLKIMIDPKWRDFLEDENWCGDELKIVFDNNVQSLEHYIKNLPKKLEGRFQHFYIQPCCENFFAAVNFVKDNPSWKLSVQIHKLINIQ